MGLEVAQKNPRILSIASPLNYLDYFPIIYRDRSQGLDCNCKHQHTSYSIIPVQIAIQDRK